MIILGEHWSINVGRSSNPEKVLLTCWDTEDDTNMNCQTSIAMKAYTARRLAKLLNELADEVDA